MKSIGFLVFFLSFNAALAQEPASLPDSGLPAHGTIKLWPDESNFSAEEKKDFITPTKKLSANQYPVFTDDIGFAMMELAIQRQLERYRRFPAQGTIKFGSTKYPLSHVTKTLSAFLELTQATRACIAEAPALAETCFEFLNAEIHDRFDVYAPNLTKDDPRNDQEKSTFFTSYYTPTLRGSRVRGGEFRHGIYELPGTEALKKSTRVQIHFEDRLEGKNLSTFYVTDLFELYLLHVQGGGRIVYEEDGQQKSKYVHYNGTNGQSFRFISKYMIEKGYISDPKIESQRDFLLKHPEKEREIYEYCPSYVYYAEKDFPATGSGGVSVTNGRSIATDWRHYGYKGLLTFIEAQRPTEDSTPENVVYKDFSRFMLDQDTGGAITGKARVDIFHGEDKYAEIAAFNTQHTGNLYYLMLKQ